MAAGFGSVPMHVIAERIISEIRDSGGRDEAAHRVSRLLGSGPIELRKKRLGEIVDQLFPATV